MKGRGVEELRIEGVTEPGFNPNSPTDGVSQPEPKTHTRPYVPIETLDFFCSFEHIADVIWSQVATWKPFPMETLGKQLVRSVDSINLNLAEGDGRYSRLDAIHFFVIARASARESRLSIQRAVKRGLIPDKEGTALVEQLTEATKKLNLFIRHRRALATSSKSVRESVAEYGDPMSIPLTP